MVPYGLDLRFADICEPCREQDLIPRQYHARLCLASALPVLLRQVFVCAQMFLQKDAAVFSVHVEMLVAVVLLWFLRSIAQVLVLGWKGIAASDILQPHHRDSYKYAIDLHIESLVEPLERSHQHMLLHDHGSRLQFRGGQPAIF